MNVSSKPNAVSDRYLQLIRQFPLRRIRSKAELATATSILDELFGRDHPDPGEADYVEVLAGLVEEFERKSEPSLPRVSGIAAIKVLMEEHGFTQAALAKKLRIGTSLMSMVLSGARPITANHARRLAEIFAVDAGVFLS